MIEKENQEEKQKEKQKEKHQVIRTEIGSKYDSETYNKLKILTTFRVSALVSFDLFLLRQTETTLYRHIKDLWKNYKINLSKTTYNAHKYPHTKEGQSRLSRVSVFYFTLFSTAWGLDLFDFCGLIDAKERHEIGAEDLPEAWRLPFQP